MSEFRQNSFKGGMNLLVDDTRLGPDEYREAFNIRNRFDVLEPILNAANLVVAPVGLKQGLYTFGDYVLLFVAGNAYYQRRSTTGWQQIAGFSMSPVEPRYYVVVVPLATTNYGRIANGAGYANAGILQTVSVVTSVAGDKPGVLVQDGINQPQFIYLDSNGYPVCKVTQKYEEWIYDPTGASDKREYVPIGRFMEWMDGILYIVSPDRSKLYRSVTGRPLDCVVNVTPTGDKGGNAETTAYSVGAGDITCIKALNNGSLFVSTMDAGCFFVTVNRTPSAPTLFGEPTFIRQFITSGICLSDLAILDTLGDTVFIDPEGIRSFDAILQTQNEGRNSIFSLKVSPLFKGIQQTASTVAGIIFDNYALFSVNTTYGYVILVYDTLTKCFCGMDLQTGGSYIKQFAKIETNVVECYAITGDNLIYKLYSGTTYATATIRTQAFCGVLPESSYEPKVESKVLTARMILNNIRQNSTVALTTYTNNRLNTAGEIKTITYSAPGVVTTSWPVFSDTDSQLSNILFSVPNARQGWKNYFLLSWTGGGTLTNLYAELKDETPMSSLSSQTTTL